MTLKLVFNPITSQFDYVDEAPASLDEDFAFFLAGGL